MNNNFVGIVSFIIICFWWVWFLGIMAPPPTQPFIPWAVDSPMGIYLEDPFQFQEALKRNKLEIEQAKDFFLRPHRDPTRQIVLQRNTV